MLKWVIAFGFLCLSPSLLAKENKRYFPLGAEREFYADMASIRPHPDNERLLTVNFVSNISEGGWSMVGLQHLNCTAGTIIHHPNGVVEVYDGLYGKGKLLFSLPMEAQQVALSDKLTPLNIFSAFACDWAGKPLFGDPDMMGKMMRKLTE